ncbi:hypothetical protein [Pseudomonas leptonychotis]|uniref:hypothetical protein n=1 Tax=Pseudomonas leptonychotis TaxID=2448482 RepID=UPI003862FC0B
MDEAYLALIETPVGDTGEVEREYLVSLQLAEVEALTVGEQGPRGAPGQPGPAGGSAVQRQAGETISALIAAYEVDGSVYALDYRDAAHADLLVGITLSAATTGEAVNLQSSGPLDDSSWSWVPGPVWVGIDGRLTQAPPDDGIDLLIGSAVSATRIALNLQRPIFLE